jgi:Tol biopolymer transport system component
MNYLKFSTYVSINLFVIIGLNSCSSSVVNQHKEQNISKNILPSTVPTSIIKENKNNSNVEKILEATPKPQTTPAIILQEQIFLNGSPVPRPSILTPTPIPDPDKTIYLRNDVNIPNPIYTNIPVTQSSLEPINKVTRGEKIVYTSLENNINQIYTINKDGTDRKRISNELKNQNMASFSYDGSKIYFINSLIDNSNDIYKSNIDGTSLERVTNLAQKIYYPKISETNKIIYIFNNQLYLIENDDITYQISKSENKISLPTWINKNEIAFLNINNNSMGNIYSIDINGKNLKQITNSNDIVAFDLKDNIIVYSNMSGLWVSDIKTGNKKQIYTDEFISQISLAPNKNDIVFTSSNNQKKQIYVIDIDGNNLKNISDNKESFDPSW